MREKLNSPFYVFSVIFVALFFFLVPFDTDLGWHLRYGNYFLQNLHFLKTNTLTYYLQGYHWPNSYTFYQIIVTLIYNSLGFWGLSIINSILFAISFIIYDLINPKLTRINILLFILVTLFGWNVFFIGFRAQIFTFTFITALIYFLTRYPKGSKRLYILIPLFALWANLHGAFILGLAIFSFYVASFVYKKEWKDVYTLAPILFLSILATLLNPYGIGVYEEALRHIQVPLKNLIAEWTEPRITTKLMVILFSSFSFYSLWKYKIKNKFFWLLTIVFFTYLSFTAKRNTPLYALIISIYSIEVYKKQLTGLANTLNFTKLTNATLVLGIAYTLFTNVPKTANINGDFDLYCSRGILPMPCKAVNFIKQEKLEGENVFSSYEWGGFLEWQLPNYKFFVDGRTPAWPTPEGKSPYTVYLEIIQARPGYQESLDKYKTDWLLIGAGTFLDLELQDNQDAPWKEIYRDDISVIYLPS